MAIRKKPEADAISLPAKLSSLLLKGFTEQFMKTKFDTLFGKTKKEVIHYLDTNEDGFDADLGKGFKCEQGTVIYTATARTQIDRDKLIDLIQSGKVTIEQVIGVVSSFENEDLEKTIGSAEFAKLATKGETFSLAFRGSAEWKQSCEEQFGGTVSAPAVAPAAKAAAPAEEIIMKVDTKQVAVAAASNAKAKAAAAAAKAKSKAPAAKTAEDDLDAILKG